jgi:hypothetical protein
MGHGVLALWYIFICVIAISIKGVVCNFNAFRKGDKDYVQLCWEET